MGNTVTGTVACCGAERSNASSKEEADSSLGDPQQVHDASFCDDGIFTSSWTRADDRMLPVNQHDIIADDVKSGNPWVRVARIKTLSPLNEVNACTGDDDVGDRGSDSCTLMFEMFVAAEPRSKCSCVVTASRVTQTGSALTCGKWFQCPACSQRPLYRMCLLPHVARIPTKHLRQASCYICLLLWSLVCPCLQETWFLGCSHPATC